LREAASSSLAPSTTFSFRPRSAHTVGAERYTDHMTQGSWIALTVVVIAAVAGPYAILALRRRFLRPALPLQSYAPHLVLLCAAGFAPMVSNGGAPAGTIVLAFVVVFAIWALCVAANEWFLRRRALKRGACRPG